MLLITIEGFRLAEKREVKFLIFHANASKFSHEERLGFSIGNHMVLGSIWNKFARVSFSKGSNCMSQK